MLKTRFLSSYKEVEDCACLAQSTRSRQSHGISLTLGVLVAEQQLCKEIRLQRKLLPELISDYRIYNIDTELSFFSD